MSSEDMTSEMLSHTWTGEFLQLYAYFDFL